MSARSSARRLGSAYGPPAAPRVIVTMRRILAFLGRHLGENSTLGELAAMAAMSRSHFSHTFHAVFGQPLLVDYVRDLRHG